MWVQQGAAAWRDEAGPARTCALAVGTPWLAAVDALSALP